MMQVIVNGEEKQYDKEMTLLEMMNDLSVADKVMAAAVNMNIVKQDVWDAHILNDGDKVELLDFVGGG
jgi:sulfur carrier protein